MPERRHASPPRAIGEERTPGLRLVGGTGHGRRPRPTSVLVAYGDRLVRAGLQALLERERDIEVVRTAGEGEEALALARELAPDVAVLDLALPGLGAIEVTRRIAADAAASETRTMVLATAAHDRAIFAALHAGALGFLLDPDCGELVAAIQSVAGGAAALSPAVVRRVVAGSVPALVARAGAGR
jgi:DNA-binding NarL/FixJ family response regulator